MRIRIICSALCISFLQLGSAFAQEPGVQWTTDLEAAKAAASKSGQLVLVHFYTPDCKPCAVLDRDVFSQPSVAAIVQQQYIPVKLNALESRAVADSLGVTRVPTDVVLSPLGQVIDRSVSPNSPTAYMAHVSGIATKHRHGQMSPFTQTAAQTQPAQVPNEAYANLNIGGTGATATAVPPTSATPAPPAAAVSNPYAMTAAPAPMTAPTYEPTTTPAATATAVVPPATPAVQQPTAPLTDNRYAMNGSVTSTPVMNPYASGMAAQPAPATPPQMQQNPMAAAPTTTTPPTAQIVENPAYTPSATTTAPAQPTATLTVAMPQLPPGSPPLGFDGYCPVSMKRQVTQLPESQWTMVRGDTRFGLEHRGRVYLFASESCRQEFLTNPDAYAPALSGLDPVLFLEQNQLVAGTSKHGMEYKGQFYLFSSEQSMNKFRQRADLYSTGVQQAMRGAPGRMVR